jgi:glycosyltransferase involved in cell wall biosynthesis
MAAMTTPVRIMRVIARMNVGGPAWEVSVLTRALEDSEFTTQLICGHVPNGEVDFVELRDPTLRVTRLHTLSRSIQGISDLRSLWSLWLLMRKWRPQIVHTHTAKAGVLGRVAAILAGVPILVHTFHGHVLHGYFSPISTRFIIAIERSLARRTTVIATVGTQVRDDLLDARIGNWDRYLVYAPGVDVTDQGDRNKARKALRLPSDAPVVAYVGRLTAIKRPDRLIETFTRILSTSPSAILLIAGEGDLFDKTREWARPLGDSVRFCGWKGDLSEVFAAADLAILTSDNEGMPVSLIEASMAGLPCVTSDVGSCREVVLDGVTGLVVKSDPSALAEAALAILHDGKKRSLMGAAARSHAIDRFSTERLIQDHRNLYRRLLAQRS